MVEIHHLRFNHRANQDSDFADYLLRVGDGVEPTEPAISPSSIKLPEEIVAPESWTTSDLLDEVFPNLVEHAMACAEAGGINTDTDFFKSRAVLSPKNTIINDINAQTLEKMESVGATITTYLSVDSILAPQPEDAMNYPLDFLHSLNPSGLPPHELRLTPGAIVIVLRNIDSELGLVNGCRCIVKRCLGRYLDVLVLTGRAAGQRVYIPRIPMAPKTADLPFILSRRQFPVRLAWAMTINKAQGQSLDRAGIALPEPVFAHGQLYVALSRVGAFQKVKVLVAEGVGQGHYSGHTSIPDGTYTRNIVWPEALLDQTGPAQSNTAKRGGTHSAGIGAEDDALVEYDPEVGSSAVAPLSTAYATSSDLADEWEHDILIPRLLAADGLQGFEQLLQEAHKILDPKSEMLHVASPGNQGEEDNVSVQNSPVETDSDAEGISMDEEETDFETSEVPAIYPLYFETQEDLKCGSHALNNVFGEPIFTDEELNAACEALVQESLVPDDHSIISDPQVLADHMNPHGWYSAAAISMVLRRTFRYELQLGNQLRFDLNALEESAVIGAITNIKNRHWVALKYIDGQMWLLDSTEHPRVLPAPAFREFVNENPHTYVIRS